MKLFDIDWAEFIGRLTEWEQLSVPARKAFLELESSEGIDVTEFNGYAADLVEAGFLSDVAEGRRVRLTKEWTPFARVVHAMTRHDLFGQPSPTILGAYLRDHFTAKQLTQMTPLRFRSYYGDHTHLLRLAGSVDWIERLLAAQSGNYMRQKGDRGKSLLGDPAIFKAVRHIVGEFKTFDRPVALRGLPGRFSELSSDLLGKAILAGIRYLFLFPAIRPGDRTPIIGLWPTITERLHRPQPGRPEQVDPDETYHSALLMDDITAILVTAAVHPLRIRGNDEALFAKVQKEIVANLGLPPEWISDTDGFSAAERISSARRLLRTLKYAETVGEAGKDLALQITDQGADWLASNAKQRLQAILDQLNPDRSKRRKKQGRAASFESNDCVPEFVDDYGLSAAYGSFQLMPSTVRFTCSPQWNPLAALAQAFDTLGGNDCVSLEDFLSWHSQELNPLLQLKSDGRPMAVSMGWSTYEPTEEEMEIFWWNYLSEFIHTRLIPLGGLRMGIVGKHRDYCITLTDAGRYLLGLAEDFDYGLEHEGDHPILVQPNFDVVFTLPSPHAEASIGRFAQRKGRRVGTLFKLTKQSILAAACAGMTTQQVLDTLRQASAKPVPANVKREIEGWFDQCRRITVRRAILVDCPDAQTAALVVAAGGKKATALSETVIELPGSKRDAALFRKLDAMGVFANQPKPTAKRRRKKRPRKSRW